MTTWLIALALKATVVLMIAGVAVALLWRASAAVRHLVWCAGLASVLALPLVSGVMPKWEVPLPDPSPVTEPVLVDDGAPSTTAAIAASGAWLPDPVVLIAASGAACGLLWMTIGYLGVVRLSRRAEVIGAPAWLEIARATAEWLGLRRPVLLLRSGAAPMPATFGLLWPSVVIPPAAEGWPDDRKRAVLAHELAHVKRFDTVTQALAQVACALFWWHPLVWFAARRLRIERERACDDLVLGAGARPSDYAGHLLEIARTQRALRMPAPSLVSMARPSQLESRLLSVLDAARVRGAATTRATLLTIVAALLIVAPLAAIRPAQAMAGEPRNPVDDLIAMQSVGADAAYVRELEVAGYGGLSVDEIVRMKSVGVTGPFIEEMNGAGYGRLTIDALVAASSVGMTRQYLDGARSHGHPNVSLRDAIRMKAVGVTFD